MKFTTEDKHNRSDLTHQHLCLFFSCYVPSYVTYQSSSDGEQPLWQRIKTLPHTHLRGSRAPAWTLSASWWILHIPSAASLGFAKWIREAWVATFLASCTRCTLSWAVESLNTCWASLWPFGSHQEPAERSERKRDCTARRREWLMTAKSINWMSGQLLHGLSCAAVIKQSAHYVLKWVKNELSA